MKITANKEGVGIFAQEQVGKTTLFKKLMSTYPKENFVVLDTNKEYEDYPNRMPVGIYDYNATYLNKFVRYARTFKMKHVIFEDLDLFNPQDSTEFDAWCINGMHQNLGGTVISRRILGMNKKFLIKMRHLFLGYGLIVNDLDYLFDENVEFNWNGKPLSPQESYDLYHQVKPFTFLYHDKVTKETRLYRL